MRTALRWLLALFLLGGAGAAQDPVPSPEPSPPAVTPSPRPQDRPRREDPAARSRFEAAVAAQVQGPGELAVRDFKATNLRVKFYEQGDDGKQSNVLSGLWSWRWRKEGGLFWREMVADEKHLILGYNGRPWMVGEDGRGVDLNDPQFAESRKQLETERRDIERFLRSLVLARLRADKARYTFVERDVRVSRHVGRRRQLVPCDRVRRVCEGEDPIELLIGVENAKLWGAHFPVEAGERPLRFDYDFHTVMLAGEHRVEIPRRMTVYRDGMKALEASARSRVHFEVNTGLRRRDFAPPRR